jgi:hypothetical protein
VRDGGTIHRMPLDLTDTELATAATACRALAYQEGERAKKMENPTTRGPIESAAQRYAALAVKLEAARSTNRSISVRPIPLGLRNDKKHSKPKP